MRARVLVIGHESCEGGTVSAHGADPANKENGGENHSENEDRKERK